MEDLSRKSTDQLIRYFITRTDQRFEEGNGRFDKIEIKLDQLFEFKWQIIGGSLVASAFLSLAVSIVVSIIVKQF